MEIRPRIKIRLTTFDKIIELLGWLALIQLWALLAWNYSRVPETIATHFNASGKPDHYGSKSTLWMVPVITTIIFLGMTFLLRFPQIYNYPVKITEQNAGNQYTSAIRLIRYLKSVIVFVFLIIVYKSLNLANGQAEELGIWFLPLVMLLIFVPIIVYLVRVFKAK